MKSIVEELGTVNTKSHWPCTIWFSTIRFDCLQFDLCCVQDVHILTLERNDLLSSKVNLTEEISKLKKENENLKVFYYDSKF